MTEHVELSNGDSEMATHDFASVSCSHNPANVGVTSPA